MKLQFVFLSLTLIGLLFRVDAVYAVDSCQSAFATPESAQLSPTAKQAVLDLFHFTEGYDQHKVEIKDGKGYVKIDRLVRNQTSFKRHLYRAIKAGGIAEVDAGLVAGPKVLTLLSRLKMVESASGEPILFHGHMRPSGLLETLNRQLGEMESGKVTEGAWFWTPTDVTDFHEAIKSFELEKVCKAVYGVALKYCGYLNFEFRSGSGDVKWEKRILN